MVSRGIGSYKIEENDRVCTPVYRSLCCCFPVDNTLEGKRAIQRVISLFFLLNIPKYYKRATPTVRYFFPTSDLSPISVSLKPLVGAPSEIAFIGYMLNVNYGIYKVRMGKR